MPRASLIAHIISLKLDPQSDEVVWDFRPDAVLARGVRLRGFEELVTERGWLVVYDIDGVAEIESLLGTPFGWGVDDDPAREVETLESVMAALALEAWLLCIEGRRALEADIFGASECRRPIQGSDDYDIKIR